MVLTECIRILFLWHNLYITELAEKLYELQHKLYLIMCVQQWFRSVCAFMQSNLSSHGSLWIGNEPNLFLDSKDWSDCVNARSNLRLYWMHMSVDTLSFFVIHKCFVYNVQKVACAWDWQKLIGIYACYRNIRMPVKQDIFLPCMLDHLLAN